MPSRPNVLVFMTDQMQADVAAPDHPCRMPHASRLASEGVRFTRAFTPTAHCCPSRATFMTGLYPSRHGVYNNVLTPTAIHAGLYEGVRCFSESLREAGYRMLFCGKWHVSAEEDPADRGWEELLEEHSDYRTAAVAIDALQGLAGSREPWFLFVGPQGPHDPFVVPEPYDVMHDPRTVRLPPSFRDTLEDKPRVYQRQRRQYWGQLSEDEVRESIAHYWGFCALEDALLGRVLDALAATGQAANTLVLFMSDHGDYAGAHGLYCKGVPAFREAYQVPVIARWPAGLKDPGREVNAFVTLADFAPTFLELAGLEPPAELTGRSLAPFLAGESPPDWPDAFHSQFNGVELYYTQRMVVTDRWKYVYNGFDFDELYDLESDPHEMVNLADRPEHEPVKRELVRRMWRFADREADRILFNPYVTVALAPWGPADALS